MKRYAQLLMLVAVVSLLSASASADVVYHFTGLSGFNQEIVDDVTVTVPTFITGLQTFNAGDPNVSCSMSGVTCYTVNFETDYPGYDRFYLFSSASGGETDLYYFP